MLKVLLVAALALFAAVVSGEQAHFTDEHDRSPGVVGGKMEAELSEDRTREAALAALKQFNMQSNDAFAYSLLEIVKATKQVVAGMRYDLTLKVVRTACLNDALHQQDLGTCAPELGGERYIEAAVLIQPWKQPPMTATIKLPPRTEL